MPIFSVNFFFLHFITITSTKPIGQKQKNETSMTIVRDPNKEETFHEKSWRYLIWVEDRTRLE